MQIRRRLLLVMECTIGGTRRHLAQLAQGLDKDRFNICIVASAERDVTFREDLKRMAEAGCEVVEMPMVRSIQLGKDWAHSRAIRELMRSFRPDIVHTHSSKAGALGRFASIRERIGRRVHTPHTFAFAFHGGFSGPKRALFYGIERYLGARTDRLICVSPSEGEEAKQLKIIANDRIRVVPNGVDATPFLQAPTRDNARRELGLDPEKKIALVVALQNRAKGQLDAIEALSQIEEKRRPQLLLAGGISDLEYGREVESAIRRFGVASSVNILGHRNDIPCLLAACDVALVPSLWEGMPYSVLEAMAAGRAVVATATNGSRDAIIDGKTGILVPVRDTRAIAMQLESLLYDEPRCERMGRAGRSIVLEQYTMQRMVARTAAVYDEVCP